MTEAEKKWLEIISKADLTGVPSHWCANISRMKEIINAESGRADNKFSLLQKMTEERDAALATARENYALAKETVAVRDDCMRRADETARERDEIQGQKQLLREIIDNACDILTGSGFHVADRSDLVLAIEDLIDDCYQLEDRLAHARWQRGVILNKPEDRLWHAEDNTWWQRKDGRLTIADAPGPVKDLGNRLADATRLLQASAEDVKRVNEQLEAANTACKTLGRAAVRWEETAAEFADDLGAEKEARKADAETIQDLFPQLSGRDAELQRTSGYVKQLNEHDQQQRQDSERITSQLVEITRLTNTMADVSSQLAALRTYTTKLEGVHSRDMDDLIKKTERNDSLVETVIGLANLLVARE